MESAPFCGDTCYYTNECSTCKEEMKCDFGKKEDKSMNGAYRVYQNDEEIVVEVSVSQVKPGSALVVYAKLYSSSH